MIKNKIFLILLVMLIILIGIFLTKKMNLKNNINNMVTYKSNSIENKIVETIVLDSKENSINESNIIEENIIENNSIEENIIINESNVSNEEVNKEELEYFENNEEKSVSIVKEHWGNDSINRFNAYENSDGTYTVEIIKPDTTVWCRYIVNLETEMCEVIE